MFSHRNLLPLKPVTQLAVDYSHWLSPYLAACYMQNELGPTAKMIDLTLHANHGVPTGTTMQVGAYGRERVFASTNLVAVPYGPQLDSATIWPGSHIRATIILARVKSTSGATSNQVICCRKYNGTTSIPYFLGIGGINAASGVGVYNSGFSSTGVTTDVRADNKYHVICGVLVDTIGAAAYSGFYYVDGVRDKYAHLTSFPNPGTLALNIGADYNNANPFLGAIESVQIFVGVPIPDISNSVPTPANHAMYLDGLIADLSRNPYQLLTAAKPKSAFILSAGLTIALTGVSSSSGIGSLTLKKAIAISGNQSALSVGSLGMKNSHAISGNQSITAIGSVVQSRTLHPTGNAINGVVGSLSYGLTKPISGISVSGNIGTVSYGLRNAISGIQSNASIGSVGYGLAKSLIGNASVSGLGSLAYGLRLFPSGVQSTGFVGTVSLFSGDITLAITGVHAVLSVGSVSPAIAVNITGTDAVGGVGLLSQEMSLKLSGVHSSGGVGAVFAPFGIFSTKTNDAEATNCQSKDSELTNGLVQDGKITTITIKEEP